MKYTLDDDDSTTSMCGHTSIVSEGLEAGDDSLSSSIGAFLLITGATLFSFSLSASLDVASMYCGLLPL